MQDSLAKAQGTADKLHNASVDGLIAAQNTYNDQYGKIMAAGMNVNDPTASTGIDQSALDAIFLTLEEARQAYDVANGKGEVGYVEAAGIANIAYAKSARDAAVQLAETVAPAALQFTQTQDALTKTMVNAATNLKQTYDIEIANIDLAYGYDLALEQQATADEIAGFDQTLAMAQSNAAKLQSDTVTNAQQVYEHALADATATQSTADFASSQKEDQAEFQANIALQKALANADVSQSTALDAAALAQEQSDSTALQDFEDGSNAAVKQAETQLITANQTWVTTVVQATAAALVQDSGFNPAISNLVAAWETFELSSMGSWVTSMTGQAAADEAQGDAQDQADKTASDNIANAGVAADAAMNTAGLQWLAEEIKLSKDEFKAFQ